jgi:hypothetical protein
VGSQAWKDDYVPEFGVDTLCRREVAMAFGLEAYVNYVFLLGRILYDGSLSINTR